MGGVVVVKWIFATSSMGRVTRIVLVFGRPLATMDWVDAFSFEVDVGDTLNLIWMLYRKGQRSI